MYAASELQEILHLFGFTIRCFQEIAYGSKWMGRRYVIESDAGKLFLKVRSNWWSKAQAEYVCALLKHLESQRFPVPSLHQTIHGQPFGIWNGHICECHEFVEGEPHTIGNLNQISAAARTLANFHSLIEKYPSPGSNLGPHIGYPTPERIRFFAERVKGFFSTHSEATSAVEHLVDEFYRLDQDYCSRFAKSNEIVHGDYHPGNLIFDGKEVVAACDFDLVQAAPQAFDQAYFLYRTVGRTAHKGGGIVKIDQEYYRAFQDEYHHSFKAAPVTEDEIGFELLRFAWYDTLLTANNTRDPDRFLLWVSDTEALSQEFDR